jgi:hypothetical protein
MYKPSLHKTFRQLTAEANLEKLRGSTVQQLLDKDQLVIFDIEDVVKLNKALSTITRVLDKYDDIISEV